MNFVGLVLLSLDHKTFLPIKGNLKMAYYKDFNLNLTTKNNGDIKTDEDENAIKNSIGNILSTLRGERRMLPTFADNTYALLFDPIDEITAGYLEDIIYDAIDEWEDRVIIKSLSITPFEDQNKYVLTVELEVTNIGEIEIKKDILKY